MVDWLLWLVSGACEAVGTDRGVACAWRSLVLICSSLSVMCLADVDVVNPDEKSIMTYVAQFLRYSKDAPVARHESQVCLQKYKSGSMLLYLLLR